MARPQVADGGGTASDMEGNCEYIELNSRGQPTRSGPPGWILGEVLTTHREDVSSNETVKE